MLESKDLELQSRLTIGTLESNAEAIRKVVLKHLEDYTPENYIGRADEAKADKALLNKAEKALNTKRLELEREYMEPFNKFKITITETCTAFVKPPSAVPGIRSSPKMRRGRPRRSMTSPSHVFVRALRRFVEEAFVYSFAIRPVRTKLR